VGDADKCGNGTSQSAAIGDLVRGWPDQFGIDKIEVETISSLMQEPQGDIDYGASCEHVHPGETCGEWIRSQVYRKLT
jgi:hypothetical protein